MPRSDCGLTSAEMRTMYGKTDYTRESQFLREMDKKLLEGDAVFEKKRKDPAEGAFSDGISREKPFQPFDQLKYARQQTKQKVEALSGSFLPGDQGQPSEIWGRYCTGGRCTHSHGCLCRWYEKAGHRLCTDQKDLMKLDQGVKSWRISESAWKNW